MIYTPIFVWDLATALQLVTHLPSALFDGLPLLRLAFLPWVKHVCMVHGSSHVDTLIECVVSMFVLLCQEEEEEEVPEFVAEDEIEESDLSDIEVSNLKLEAKAPHTP